MAWFGDSKYQCPECDGDGDVTCPCCDEERVCPACKGRQLDDELVDVEAYRKACHELTASGKGGSAAWIGVNGEWLGRMSISGSDKVAIADFLREGVTG